MMHRNRVWTVADVEDAAEFADKLTSMTWCLCNGFRHAGHLYLNDATCEDGAQEYAVVREAGMRQVESITFGWMDAERALGYINAAPGFDESFGPIDPARIVPSEVHRCRYCA